MKTILKNIFYSFPIQLLILSVRKFPILLLFWVFLFGILNEAILKVFGAHTLFLAPEYLGNVNAISASLVGGAISFFISSWNITTFIVYRKQIRFLSATSNPFLKYCINNSIIPTVFLVLYTSKMVWYLTYKELLPAVEVAFIVGGFLCGYALFTALTFYYFFKADRSIFRKMLPIYNNPKEYILHLQKEMPAWSESHLITVKWYLDSPIKVRPARDVKHYTIAFIDTILKRHHLASVWGLLAGFMFLIVLGFFLDSPFFQIPAAAGVLLLLSLLVGAVGAFTYLLGNWSILVFISLYFLLNFFFQKGWIDSSNKAFGLNYNNAIRPSYTPATLDSICTKENVEADKNNMIQVLENWKKKQTNPKPLLVLLAVSGGGYRSTAFTFSMLQTLDSLTKGKIMEQVFLITGSSGGMIGASYFRELFLEKKLKKPIHLQDPKHYAEVTADLLNPMISTLVIRDIISPVHKFKLNGFEFAKDRGYAFEEKLNANTLGRMNKPVAAYEPWEKTAQIPLLFFGSVVTRDSRKLLISTQPIRFMMKDSANETFLGKIHPDAIDFNAFFSRQNPEQLRLLTALRLNASFPLILPNVWLPTLPVVDALDAGFRDNFGIETSVRFMHQLKAWIAANTAGVLLLQINDRLSGGWEFPYTAHSITEHLTKPMLLLQYNWFKTMDYTQSELLTHFQSQCGFPLYKISLNYKSQNAEHRAALSFRLNESEKRQIKNSVLSEANKRKIAQLNQLLGIGN